MTRTITIRLPRDLEDKLPPPSTVKGEGVNAYVVDALRLYTAVREDADLMAVIVPAIREKLEKEEKK